MRPGHKAENWGDYIGLGLAREKVLASTPILYGELGDNWNDGISGPLYRALLDKQEVEDSQVVASGGGFDQNSRRGVLGGSSVEWSSGVVGMGAYLGPVDMRIRRKGIELEEIEPNQIILQDHILQHGWTFQDEVDRLNTLKLLREAKEHNDWDSLPLRDRVRDRPEAKKEAAQDWARIYGTMQGEFVKSALEVGIEKLVRRVPVVIFSKTGCP